MSEDLTPKTATWLRRFPDLSVWQEIGTNLSLFGKMMGSREVTGGLKFLYYAGCALIIFIPDFPGPIDDVIGFYLWASIWIAMNPAELVQEITADLGKKRVVVKPPVQDPKARNYPFRQTRDQDSRRTEGGRNKAAETRWKTAVAEARQKVADEQQPQETVEGEFIEIRNQGDDSYAPQPENLSRVVPLQNNHAVDAIDSHPVDEQALVADQSGVNELGSTESDEGNSFGEDDDPC